MASLHSPLSTLRGRSCGRPRLTQGQDGYATPFLYDSFIRDSTPVYPDAPKKPANALRFTKTSAKRLRGHSSPKQLSGEYLGTVCASVANPAFTKKLGDVQQVWHALTILRFCKLRLPMVAFLLPTTARQCRSISP